MSAPRSVDVTLFAEGDTLALAGSRCRTCGTVTFPRQLSCPRCAGVEVDTHPLPNEGTLWAFTEQLFPPKEPYAVQGSGFRPYVVGYVDLADVIVESRIVSTKPLHIGQPVKLVTELFTPGSDVFTYAFAPSEEPS